MELDPLSPLLCANHGWVYYYRGDYPRALKLCKRAVDLGGSDVRQNIAFLYGEMKMFEEMRREYETWMELRRSSWSPDARDLVERTTRLTMACFEDDKEAVRGFLPEVETHGGKEDGVPPA